MSSRIYTRTGDSGETALFGGGRVPKDDVRVAAYGDVDELNSAIGLARSTSLPQDIDAMLEQVQRDLFAIGGQLATPDPVKVARALSKAVIADDAVASFERAIDASDQHLAPLTAFILPGGSPAAAALHLARAVCRRAERSVVSLSHHAQVPGEFIQYLNRLSDLLFTLARVANQRAGVGDVTW